MNSMAGTARLPPDALAAPDHPGGREGSLRAFSALGSGVRARILESIAASGKTIPQLARELHLHRATLRYHLEYLRSQGLVDEVEVSGPRKVGRPAARYRTSKHARVQGFPERHYDLLGQMALEAIVDAVGVEKASAFLRKKGGDVGRSLVEAAARSAGVEEWTPAAFERFVLDGLFKDFGVASEVLSRSPDSLEYRSFTCPFLELAERMPELVCNALDRGFHAGVDEALGGVRTDRLACMGHGDPYCHYRLTWGTEGASRRPRNKRGRARPIAGGLKGGHGLGRG